MFPGSASEPAIRPEKASIAQLTDPEWEKMVLPEALLYIRSEVETVGVPTSAPCGHPRNDICLPLFGKRLSERLRRVSRRLDSFLPFPRFVIRPENAIEVSHTRILDCASILEQAIAKIPNQVKRDPQEAACPTHRDEELARAYRLKGAFYHVLQTLDFLKRCDDIAQAGQHARPRALKHQVAREPT